MPILPSKKPLIMKYAPTIIIIGTSIHSVVNKDFNDFLEHNN